MDSVLLTCTVQHTPCAVQCSTVPVQVYRCTGYCTVCTVRYTCCPFLYGSAQFSTMQCGVLYTSRYSSAQLQCSLTVPCTVQCTDSFVECTTVYCTHSAARFTTRVHHYGSVQLYGSVQHDTIQSSTCVQVHDSLGTSTLRIKERLAYTHKQSHELG